MTMLGEPSSSKVQLESEATVTSAPKRKEIFSSIGEAARIDNRSSVLYQSVMPNTSIEYILKGNNVKENIIVSAPSGSYEYDFELTLEGLTATLDKKGNVRLCDTETGASRYVIPAPYMYDAEGELSTAVSYELYTVKDGLYLLRVSADATWINAADRAFPVTIDPTLVQDTPACDSYTDANVPDGAYGYEEDIWVSNHQTAYFCLSFPSLPSGASLTEARLYISYYFPNVTTGEMLVGAYQVLEAWDEWDISYNNAPAIGTETLDTSVLIAIAATTSGLTSFDITDAAWDWVENSFSNYGIAIKRQESAEYTNTSVLLRSYEANPDEDAYIALTYTHYVPDGVYAFRNIGSSANTKWMSVEGGSVWAGSHMQRSYFPDSPKETSVFDRTGLFKISRVGDTDRYIIRLMVNNNLTFGISGTEVITKEIPSADADVAAADTFNIEWTGQGFYISPYGSTSVIRMRATSANLTIVAETEAAANFDAVWGLEQYTGEARSGAILNYVAPLTVGTTITITPVVWTTGAGYNTPHLSVATGYTDKASCTWDVDTGTGSFALHDDGELQIIAQIFNGDYALSNPLTHTLTLSLVIEDGKYFFQNVDTGKYMQIDDQKAPSYSQSNAHLELHPMDSGDYQQWQLVHIVDGYYKILSVKSGLAVCIKAGETNSNEVALVQQSYANEDRMKWKISKSDSGAYIVRPKSGEANNWCMCAGDYVFGVTTGLNVEQQKYVDNDSYMDEWQIYSFDKSLLLAIDEGIARDAYFAVAKANLQQPKNGTVSAVTTVEYTSLSIAEARSCLISCNNLIIHTHGEKTGFKISDSPNVYLSLTDIAGLDLSGLSFALLLTCKTAEDYDPFHIYSGNPVNIVEQMVLCGAETVIGFEDITYVDDCNPFAEDLTELLIAEGLSVDDALDRIQSSEESRYSYYRRLENIIVVAGNGDNVLRP